jgi:hypothetical protein
MVTLLINICKLLSSSNVYYLKKVFAFVFVICYSCKIDSQKIEQNKCNESDENNSCYTKKGATYFFVVKQISLQDSILTTDTLMLKCSGIKWEIDTMQYKITWVLYSDKLYIEEETGVIENKDKLWIHPPRLGYLKFLQFNAYPYIKFPLEINKNWNWNIEVHKDWAKNYSRITWENRSKTIRHQYTFLKDTMLNFSNIGTLHCNEVLANTKFGEEELEGKIYYNKKNGIVKLIYFSILNTKVELELFKKIDNYDFNYFE